MGLRTFRLTLFFVFGLLTVSLLSDAQQTAKVYRVGWLGPYYPSHITAFLDQLRALGWVEGQQFVMEYQTAPDTQFQDRAPSLAAALIERNVDIIVTIGTPGALAAKEATGTIPIVMAGSHLPVERGLIASLAHPGGNVTGLTNSPGEGFEGKELELLKEAVPGMSRVAVLVNPLTPGKTPRADEYARAVRRWQTAAEELGLTALVASVAEARAYPEAFALFTQGNADAIYVEAGNLNVGSVYTIMDFARAQRLPVMTNLMPILRAGGLLYYWADWLDLRRRSAVYVDKILRGAKPSELPVERPDRFQLVINLHTAKALGLTIPPTLLLQATEVIR
jgi:putative ABC transport system substrate-binding protein